MLTWSEETFDGETRLVAKDSEGVLRFAVAPDHGRYKVLELTPVVRISGLDQQEALDWCHKEFGLTVTNSTRQ